MWQPPLEGEDIDETASGNEQQQQSVAVDKKTEDNSVNESAAAEAEMPADKVR